ncbi:MAG: AAA family ATPase, partial [Bacteroidota bacterium]
IDEYDTPINHAYLTLHRNTTAFDKVLGLFRQFFGEVFKTNPYLAKGFITGILRIAKANIFSDLNNVREYTLLDEEFAASYGFTQAEVDTLLAQVPTQTPAAEIKAWYNGYTLGGEVIYNPWSIMCCLSRKGKLAPYWIDSGGTSLVDSKLLADEMQVDLQKLVAKDVIESPIITQISFDDLKKRSGLLSLLLFSGYLNPVQRLGNAFNAVYHLSIPNQEVQCVYEMRVLEWVSKQLAIDTDRYFSFAHLLAEGKIDAFKDALQQYLHNATSFHQTGEKSVELFYSGFMLGLLSILSTYYSIYSEQEGLKGRSDALLVPKPNHGTEALVLEYKVSPKADQLAAVAERGVSQILQ